jgi:hypothetical protein
MTADAVAGLAWTAMVAYGTKQTSKLCRVCSLPLLSRISSVNTSGTRTEHRQQFNFTFKIQIIEHWPSLIKIKDNFAIFILACKACWKDLSLEELRFLRRATRADAFGRRLGSEFSVIFFYSSVGAPAAFFAGSFACSRKLP